MVVSTLLWVTGMLLEGRNATERGSSHHKQLTKLNHIITIKVYLHANSLLFVIL